MIDELRPDLEEEARKELLKTKIGEIEPIEKDRLIEIKTKGILKMDIKIFSLESKINLVLWSLVLAFVLNLLPLYQFSIVKPDSFLGHLNSQSSFIFYLGWPLQFSWEGTAGGLAIPELFIVPNYLLNLIFLTVVVFIILSLVKYFRKKDIKIFSLESKISLVSWSLALGLLTDWVVMLLTQIAIDNCQFCNGGHIEAYAGLPFVVNYSFYAAIVQPTLVWFLDLFFWILVVLITLSVVRYVRNKKVLVKTI